MLEQQRIWVNRINKFYNTILGLLGGMGLMHLFMILGIQDKQEFLSTYSAMANFLCGITQGFSNFTLIFGVALTLIYK
jgi:hypothetical protein